MKITALVENTSCDANFGAEHGLSLYIETGSKKILFDMGQTDLFAKSLVFVWRTLIPRFFPMGTMTMEAGLGSFWR